MTPRIRKAVIPAAGLGTRFLPASKIVPKELLTIVDRPCVQVVMEELKAAGIEEFIVVLSPGKETLLEHFRPHPALEAALRIKGKKDLLALVEETNALGKVTPAWQDDPCGLGHAVLCAREAVGNEPFLVALADDLIDATPSCAEQMVARFREHGKALVAVQEVADSEVQKYGIVAPRFADGDAKKFLDKERRLMPLSGLVEKPSVAAAPSRLAIVGRYLLTPEIFPLLAEVKPGAGGEIQLTDGLRALNEKVGMLAYRFVGERFDAGDKLGFLEANVHYGLKHRDIGKGISRPLAEFSAAMKRKLGRIAAVLGFFFFVSALAHAYILPTEYVLTYMVKNRQSFAALEIKQRLELLDTSLPDGKTEAREHLYLQAGGDFRVDGTYGKINQTCVHQGGRVLLITDGMVTDEGRYQHSLLRDLFTIGEAGKLLAQLRAAGVETNEINLGRQDAQLFYIIGAREGDLTPTQVWISKTSFNPVRAIVKETIDGKSGNVEFRFDGYGKTTPSWYPSRTEIYVEGVLLATIRVEQANVRPSFPPTFFDLAALKKKAPPAKTVNRNLVVASTRLSEALSLLRKQF